MAYVLSIVSGLQQLGRRFDGDWTDQLHYQLTSNALIGLSIMVSFKQFGGRPIECMLPDASNDAWETYIESYCWAQDTYYLSYEQDLTRQGSLRSAHIGYYQWVAFYLLLSALSFPLPSQIWRFLSCSSGIRLESLILHAVDPKNADVECRQQAIRAIAVYLENALRFQRRLYRSRMVPHKVLRFLNLPYKAYFLTCVYIFSKLLYLTNVLTQFIIMNYFLEIGGGEKGWYGWDTLHSILNGTQWSVSGFFPRDTLCDYQVRVPGHVQRYSIQCVLSINLLMEKIFIFLWFWYHILAVITALSLLYWITVCTPPFLPRWFVQRHLELAEPPFDPVENKHLVKKFVDTYLRTDGVFILHMINMHTSTIFSSDLVAALYKGYFETETLVKTVSMCGEKQWPSIDTLHRMRSEISFVRVGEETKHPPPASSAPLLDQPDYPGPPAARSISEIVPNYERLPKFFPEGALFQHRESEEESEKSVCESPYSMPATRRRRDVQSTE